MSGEERRCKRCGDEEFRIDGYCTVYCKDLHAVERERDEAVAMAERLANRPCVEICMEARAEGDGGCGACAMCCGEQFERAMRAELLLGKAMKERDCLQQEADRLRSGTWIESDCFYFDDRDDMMGEIVRLRRGIEAYRTICVCPKEVAAGKQHVWQRDLFGDGVPCESCEWEREDKKRRESGDER